MKEGSRTDASVSVSSSFAFTGFARHLDPEDWKTDWGEDQLHPEQLFPRRFLPEDSGCVFISSSLPLSRGLILSSSPSSTQSSTEPAKGSANRSTRLVRSITFVSSFTSSSLVASNSSLGFSHAFSSTFLLAALRRLLLWSICQVHYSRYVW